MSNKKKNNSVSNQKTKTSSNSKSKKRNLTEDKDYQETVAQTKRDMEKILNKYGGALSDEELVSMYFEGMYP